MKTWCTALDALRHEIIFLLHSNCRWSNLWIAWIFQLHTKPNESGTAFDWSKVSNRSAKNTYPWNLVCEVVAWLKGWFIEEIIDASFIDSQHVIRAALCWANAENVENFSRPCHPIPISWQFQCCFVSPFWATEIHTSTFWQLHGTCGGPGPSGKKTRPSFVTCRLLRLLPQDFSSCGV